MPVVIVFGSQSALDTQKQATETLQQNMKEGKAFYLFVDTDKLDPNSELGKVARRSSEKGLGLGPTGKSDLVFTGVYKIDQKPDGQLSVGDSVATFWGGRDEISGIMRQQLQFATPKGGPKPDVSPTDNPTVPPPRPSTDNPGGRDGGTPQPKDQPRDPSKEKAKDDQPDQRKADDAKERERKEAEERRLEERKKRYKELISNTSDKGYSLEQYADGWGRFLDRAEMQNGPTRNLVDQLGRQMITGDLDGKQLAGLMDGVGKTDQASMDKQLQEVNRQLAQDGLTMKAKVDPTTGKIVEMEITNIGPLKPGEQPTSLRVTAKGEVIGSENGKQITASQASIRLAKKAEPAACP